MKSAISSSVLPKIRELTEMLPEDPSDGVDVLLVEDNPADVELTLKALRARGLAGRAHVARDGEEALEWMFGRPDVPRLVLLDLRLPKVDGVEVLRRIRACERTRNALVLVLTSQEHERQACIDLGADGFLVKPIGGGKP